MKLQHYADVNHWTDEEPRPYVENKLRSDGVRWTIAFKEGTSPLAAATFKCDRLGQLSKLTLRWGRPPQEIPDQIVQVEDGQSLHLSYRGGVPYVWLENAGNISWIFSGYDLEEVSAQGSQLSYVTVSHYVSDDGRITPASESFDHEEMLTFLRALCLGREVTVINHDRHSDDAKVDPSRKRVESPGNWCRLARNDELVGEVLWESSDSDVTPEPDGIVKQIPDPRQLRPAYSHLVSTFDADHFSSGLSPRSEREILAKVHHLVDIYREMERTQGRRPVAVNFTRSAKSRTGKVDFSPDSQSSFILNALVSEHQRLLGLVALRKVPGVSLGSGSVARQELPPVQTSLGPAASEGDGVTRRDVDAAESPDTAKSAESPPESAERYRPLRSALILLLISGILATLALQQSRRLPEWLAWYLAFLVIGHGVKWLAGRRVLPRQYLHFWGAAATFNPLTGELNGPALLQWTEEETHLLQARFLKGLFGSTPPRPRSGSRRRS